MLIRTATGKWPWVAMMKYPGRVHVSRGDRRQPETCYMYNTHKANIWDQRTMHNYKLQHTFVLIGFTGRLKLDLYVFPVLTDQD